MNPLSYIIENYNEVLIDSAAAASYEKQNAKNNQKQLIENQQMVKGDDRISKNFIKRKISPKRPLRGVQPQKNENKEALQKIENKSSQNNRNTTVQIHKEKVHDIDRLKAEIQILERDQEKMNRICCEKFHQLNEQFTMKNLQYEMKQEEINLMKNELFNTKKDIASLIKLFSSRTNKMSSPERPERNLRQSNFDKNTYKVNKDGELVRIAK